MEPNLIVNEEPTQYQVNPEPERKSQELPRKNSMQLQTQQLLKQHGWSSVIQCLIDEADIFSDSKLAIKLEQARDIVQDEEAAQKSRLWVANPQKRIMGLLSDNLDNLLRRHRS